MTKTNRKKYISRQVERVEKNLTALIEKSRQFSKMRLGLFLVGFSLGVALYYLVAPNLGWLAFGATFVIFNLVAFFHRKIDRSVRQHEIWVDLKKAQLARMDLDWSQIPQNLKDEPDGQHPFELDLNVTGKFSLHHLIDTAVSLDGSLRLKEWFLQPVLETKAISSRQNIVKEMAPLARFRDKLQLAYQLVSKDPLDGKKLLLFLEKQEIPKQFAWVLLSSAVLAVANISLYILGALELAPAWWGYSLTLYGLIYLANQRFSDPLLDASVFISEELKKLKATLFFLENYRYGDHGNLKNLCEPFWTKASRPSRQMTQITLLSFAIGLRMNPLFRIGLNLFVPWDFYLVRLLGQVEKQLQDKLANWIEVLIELEALNSLANFAYLNPGTTFPEVVKADASAFEAQKIGHPLIKSDDRKCNDFALKTLGDVALITGSNMSGKSTFLKTVGLNLVLAFAGGPVISKNFKTSLVRVFTSIQINDSITDGFSFFYQEVRRLKALLLSLKDQKQLPLFFLIDEIFKGTNNKERLIGSRSYIQALAGHNGLGAISTHDLELTNLEAQIPQISNYHFREEVVDGKMVFDYQIRTGPCPSTNALKIMQLEGLPVEE